MKINPSKLILPLAGISALASCANKAQQEETQPLNIIYIMTDDHTRQMMSCYDNRHIETPNLDRIAENGVIFYTSDQGFYMGEHGWFDKRFMYEESFSTPLVMMYPKLLSAKRGDIDRVNA